MVWLAGYESMRVHECSSSCSLHRLERWGGSFFYSVALVPPAHKCLSSRFCINSSEDRNPGGVAGNLG